MVKVVSAKAVGWSALLGVVVVGCLGKPESESPCTTTLATLTCEADTHWCCPANFDGEPDDLPACQGETRAAQTCGDTRELYRNWSTHDVTCYYDVTTGTLIGAVRRDDVQSYCADTSFTEEAGEIVPCDAESRSPIPCMGT